MRLDPQHVEETRRVTLEGFRKYSATFAGNNDEELASVPRAPRASPEPNSPVWGSTEELNLAESQEEFFSEDEESIDASLETESTNTLASRPLVFEIPTADVEFVSDDDESVTCTTGRFSTDYVAKSKVFLNELSEKNKQEADELSGMFKNMEQMRNKISKLHISPRDLEELADEKRRDADTSQNNASSVSVVNMHFGYDIDESDPLTEGSTIETLWVEEPAASVMSRALPPRNNRIRSAPVREQGRGEKVSRGLSDNAMLLKGQTVSFLDPEELAVKGRLRPNLPRRATEPPGSVRVLRIGEGGSVEAEKRETERVGLSLVNKKVTYVCHEGLPKIPRHFQSFWCHDMFPFY